MLDCAVVENGNTSEVGMTGECGCNLPYQWDSVNFKCVLNCSLDPMYDAVGDPDNDSSCACLGIAIWNGYKCTLNCTSDPFLDHQDPQTS